MHHCMKQVAILILISFVFVSARRGKESKAKNKSVRKLEIHCEQIEHVVKQLESKITARNLWKAKTDYISLLRLDSGFSNFHDRAEELGVLQLIRLMAATQMVREGNNKCFKENDTNLADYVNNLLAPTNISRSALSGLKKQKCRRNEERLLKRIFRKTVKKLLQGKKIKKTQSYRQFKRQLKNKIAKKIKKDGKFHCAPFLHGIATILRQDLEICPEDAQGPYKLQTR